MKLSAFITANTPQIVSEWEDFARSLIPSATDMTPLALRNHIQEILAFIVNDMESAQTSKEQIEKSHGEGKQKREREPSAAETHAALRLAGGFNLDQMVSEYRALRASILKLWKEARKKAWVEAQKESQNKTQNETKKEYDDGGLQELTRFNEAIDQTLTESVSHYAKKLSDSKDLFLGILTHDLRNPLGAMLGATELIPRIGPLNERQTVLISQVVESGARINEIINHLLDITKARFGSGLPVRRSHMDMGFVAQQLVDEMRVQYPDRKFVLEVSGKTEGNWDKARLGQVFSNLIGNAVQYSFKDSPIRVTLKGCPEDVVLCVHNEGIPIPEDKIATIFDSFVRVTGADEEHKTRETTNLGLGLYITNEIVTAHGGEISVESSEEGGTTFTAHFPRKVVASHEEKADLPALLKPDNARNIDSERRLH